ncbi:MAG TPA: hypothetical protein VIM71_06450 [Lacunisphaera sp.]
MKNDSFVFQLSLLAVSLLVATGCPKKNSPQVSLNQPAIALAETPASPTAPATPPPGETPVTTAPSDPFSEMVPALEAATAEKHEGLSAIQQRMDREIDSQIAARKTAGQNISLADDEKLDTATEDFAEKLRMLTLSSPEVWESAKHDTELALKNVRSAYAAIMNKPIKK